MYCIQTVRAGCIEPLRKQSEKTKGKKTPSVAVPVVVAHKIQIKCQHHDPPTDESTVKKEERVVLKNLKKIKNFALSSPLLI